jgi:nucleotide-binding universal stress UspA family protein
VLHVVEHEEESRFLGTLDRSALETREREKRVQLEAACREVGCPDTVRIRIASGNPHAEILHALESSGVDLLCMGTVARSGLAGVLTGNTAENVLPWVDCSVLAVKPEAFQAPEAS